MIGRDLPARQRQRDGFRRRIPRTLPKVLEPAAIQKLMNSEEISTQYAHNSARR
jgi:hypothetical protein